MKTEDLIHNNTILRKQLDLLNSTTDSYNEIKKLLDKIDLINLDIDDIRKHIAETEAELNELQNQLRK